MRAHEVCHESEGRQRVKCGPINGANASGVWNPETTHGLVNPTCGATKPHGTPPRATPRSFSMPGREGDREGDEA